MANLDPITGGGGGTAFRDGTEGSGANFGFLKNTPVEINEAEVPVKIHNNLQLGVEYVQFCHFSPKCPKNAHFWASEGQFPGRNW